MKGLIIFLFLSTIAVQTYCEDLRLVDLDPGEAQQHIDAKDTSLKYAPKVDSNVPATRVLGNEPTQVLEDIYLANQYHGQDGLGGYLYGYAVPDIAKTERKQAGGDLRGAYNYINGDGQEIKVEYWDDGTGFHQTDNVDRIQPKQVADTPEVQAAKDEHARLWAEQAERNSHAPVDPNAHYQQGGYQAQGSQAQASYQQSPNQYNQQAQKSNQGYKSSGQQQYNQQQPQPGGAGQQGFQSQQKPQQFAQQGQQQGAGGPGQQGQQNQGYGQQQSQGFGQQQSQGQQKPGGYNAQQQSGQPGQQQQQGYSAQAQAQTQQSGQYGQHSQGFSQQKPVGAAGQQQHSQQAGQQQSHGYSAGQSGQQGHAYNQGGQGQYSQQQSNYAANPNSGNGGGGNDDDGQWKAGEEEQGPPKGFFYNFDYPVGIIVSKQGRSGGVKRDVADIYSQNKKLFESQLKSGGGAAGGYQVHA